MIAQVVRALATIVQAVIAQVTAPVVPVAQAVQAVIIQVGRHLLE